jgi:DNA-binding beta-propeller fold protein YncE
VRDHDDGAAVVRQLGHHLHHRLVEPGVEPGCRLLGEQQRRLGEQLERDAHPLALPAGIAGCGPARVIVSGNGDDVWVTDRESNALVAFSAAKLLTKPEHSLIARVNVGQNPIGETFIRGGTQIMVANANLSNYPGAYTLTLVSTQEALQGVPVPCSG